MSSCLNEHEAEAVVPVDRVRRVFYGTLRLSDSHLDFCLHPSFIVSLYFFSDVLRLCCSRSKVSCMLQVYSTR